MNDAQTHLNTLLRSASVTLIAHSALVICCALILHQASVFSFNSILASVALWCLIVWQVLKHLNSHSPHIAFGTANTITSFRAAVSVLFLGLVLVADTVDTTSSTMWYLTITAVIALLLDGVDGWVARSTRMTSEFGARFDMEIDALLILVLTLFIWQSRLAGIWILALGLMRYAFVAFSIVLPALKEPLYPSIRRKSVCVIQVVALCLMLSPLLGSSARNVVGALALLCLAWSFARDSYWLLRKPDTKPDTTELPIATNAGHFTQTRVRHRTSAKPGTQPIKDISA